MLQATIPLNALRKELRRRIKSTKAFAPFGKTIASFCGDAQAPAIEIHQTKTGFSVIATNQGNAPMTTTYQHAIEAAEPHHQTESEGGEL